MDPIEQLKHAIDRVHPTWRQEGYGGPTIVMVDGVPVLDASRLTYGGQGGHLTHPTWWQEGGPGAPVKSGFDTLEPFAPRVEGFLHVARTSVASGGILSDALAFFSAHEGEFSCFIPVEFVREGSESYPWRCRRRRF